MTFKKRGRQPSILGSFRSDRIQFEWTCLMTSIFTLDIEIYWYLLRIVGTVEEECEELKHIHRTNLCCCCCLQHIISQLILKPEEILFCNSMIHLTLKIFLKHLLIHDLLCTHIIFMSSLPFLPHVYLWTCTFRILLYNVYLYFGMLFLLLLLLEKYIWCIILNLFSNLSVHIWLPCSFF